MTLTVHVMQMHVLDNEINDISNNVMVLQHGF